MRKSMPLRNNVIHDAFSIAFIKIGHDQEEKRTSTKRNINDYGEYKVGKLPRPTVIGPYTDNTNRDQLD